MKLTGDNYVQFWKDRMAKGPNEAGYTSMNTGEVARQGAEFAWAMFKLLRRHDVKPTMIGELGSGWGRMARHMINQFGCSYVGVDLSQEAVDACREKFQERFVLFLQGLFFPPEMAGKFDLIYTCTCLQHITDEGYYQVALESIVRALKPGGWVLLLENVTIAPDSRHIRGHGADAYLTWFTSLGFEVMSRGPDIVVKGEPHMVVLLRAP